MNLYVDYFDCMVLICIGQSYLLRQRNDGIFFEYRRPKEKNFK
jgi:hypothetical protein